MKRTDYLMIGAGVAAVGVAVWYARQGFVSVADAAASLKRTLAGAASIAATKLNPASPDNYVNEVVNDALSAAAGRQTSAGSVLADLAPSAPEKQVNKPGFWISPGRFKAPSTATGDPFAYVDAYHPAPFDPPGFLKPSTTGDTGMPMYDQLGNVIN